MHRLSSAGPPDHPMLPPGHAVLCACHAVYLAGDVSLDTSWVLQPFQIGEPPYYLEHLAAAVHLAALDPDARLILCGGQTRAEAGPRSEAQGYFDVAEKLHWFGHPEVRTRTLLEEFSRDSFENLLFGICRLKQALGHYPQRITAVSWAFKRDRFDFHRATLEIPAASFAFEGVNNPVDLSVSLQGEQRALAEFHRDPLGQGELLSSKRRQRNPFGQRHDYRSACPEFTRFMGTIRLQPPESVDVEPRRS